MDPDTCDTWPPWLSFTLYLTFERFSILNTVQTHTTPSHLFINKFVNFKINALFIQSP